MVIVTKQTVQVILEYLTKGTTRANAEARKFNKGVESQRVLTDSLTKNQRRSTEFLEQNRIAQQGFGKTMRMNREKLKQFNQQGYKFNSLGGRMANKLRMATHGMRGFRMEMLGVMFFGMMLQKTFSGLIRTSLEWMGVMEVFTMALGILFLPVAFLLLKWALKFLEWVSKLTPEQKKLINTIVLFGLALGAVLFVVGSFALGIGSLIMAFSWLFTPLGAIIGLFGGLALFSFLSKQFDDLSGVTDKLREKFVLFGFSGEAFDKVKDKIIEWYNVVKKYLFGDEEVGEIGLVDRIITKIKNTIEEKKEDFITAGKTIMASLVDGAKRFFTENPLVLIGAIVGGLAAGPVGAGIGAAIGRGLQALDLEKMDEVIAKGLEILDGILTGLYENKEKIGNAMEKIIEAIGNWIADNGDKLIELGFDIAAGILKGLMASAMNIGAAIGDWITGAETKTKFRWEGRVLRPETLPEFQRGGIMPHTVLAMLHAGERVTPANRVGGGREVILNVTYNVEVSDKEEMERLLRDNNLELVEEVKRLHAI